MTQDDLAAAQDEQRTKRAFISFLSTALNTDQTLATEDGFAVNTPRQYQVVGTAGTVGVEGAPRSNAQASAVVMSPMMLLIGLAALYLVLHK